MSGVFSWPSAAIVPFGERLTGYILGFNNRESGLPDGPSSLGHRHYRDQSDAVNVEQGTMIVRCNDASESDSDYYIVVLSDYYSE